jgi:hypothetical protein
MRLRLFFVGWWTDTCVSEQLHVVPYSWSWSQIGVYAGTCCPSAELYTVLDRLNFNYENSLGLVRFGPEQPGLWPKPFGSNRPGSKPGRIKSCRSVRYGLEYKLANPGLFLALWPGMETGPPTSETYLGDGATRDSQLSTVRHEATARGITRGCDDAARGSDGNASPRLPCPLLSPALGFLFAYTWSIARSLLDPLFGPGWRQWRKWRV